MKYVEMQGEKVPALGFGTWQIKGRNCVEGVKDALDMGYRHIDTAQAYGNEAEVGKAIAESDVSRENIWLTTKVWRDNLNRENLKDSVEKSLEKLGTNYVDLLLIHWPFPEIELEPVLEEMNDLVEENQAFNIGVSNFTAEQIERVQELSRVKLLANQAEYHPFLSQEKVLETCRAHDMMLTAYSPLARGDVIGNETLEEIGSRYGKTEAQIALRWLVQQEGVSAIPKAASHVHREDNFNIFDFELTSEEMERIHNLTRGDRKVNPSFAPDRD